MIGNIPLAIDALNHIILGKPVQIKLAITCLLAKGHLLIEDLPGMGKTTLSHALAKVLGLEFQRIQFTSDLLPGDITGSSIYRPSDESFVFHPGPIFSQVVLADEVNRATPKSQSALLEAMEEFQVTIDGKSRDLPAPFFVIATQNPFHQIGTYPLPESQLDRFLIRISLGYPSRQLERQLLTAQESKSLIEQLTPVMSAPEFMKIQSALEQVVVSDKLLDYLQDLIEASRSNQNWPHGLSPRAGRSLLKAAKAWALLEGRKHVIPEDVKAIWMAVAEHRLVRQSNANVASNQAVAAMLQSVAIPR